MTRAFIKHGHHLLPGYREEEVEINLADFVWNDLRLGLIDAPREDGWEGSAVVVHWADRTKVYWVSCDDVRAELERRSRAMEERRLKALKTAHTRQLLKWLDHARRFGGFFSPCDSKSDYGWNYAEIKAELATRPHIPGKLEARAKRQEAARQARSGKRG